MSEYQRHSHEFPPVWDKQSRILILGSFPSVKSREEGFFTDIREIVSGKYCLPFYPVGSRLLLKRKRKCFLHMELPYGM